MLYHLPHTCRYVSPLFSRASGRSAEMEMTVVYIMFSSILLKNTNSETSNGAAIIIGYNDIHLQASLCQHI